MRATGRDWEGTRGRYGLELRWLDAIKGAGFEGHRWARWGFVLGRWGAPRSVVGWREGMAPGPEPPLSALL